MLNERKHGQVAVAAWQRAFRGDPNARLVFKSRWQVRGWLPNDSRITFVEENRPSRGIADFYGSADVLLALGNEGFGLPLVEAMATGLPVIALTSEGQADICDAAGPSRVLAVEPVRWEISDDTPHGIAGLRGVPGIGDVSDRLREVAADADIGRQIGRSASDWVRSNLNIWSKPERLVAAISEQLTLEMPSCRLRINEPLLLEKASSIQGEPPTTSASTSLGTATTTSHVGERSAQADPDRVVFIAWSNDRGLKVARELKQITERRVGDDVAVFVSNPGIRPGSNPYAVMLEQHLLRSDALITVLTEESKESAWVIWESASVWARGGLVVPVFIGVRPNDVPGPLTHLCQGGELLDIEFLNAALAEIVAKVGRGVIRELTAQEFSRLRNLAAE